MSDDFPQRITVASKRVDMSTDTEEETKCSGLLPR